MMSNITNGYCSEKEFHSIFNSITDMITVHDGDFNIVYANRAARNSLRLPPPGAAQAKCYRSYHNSQGPPESCPSCRCLRTGQSASFEFYEPYLRMHLEIRALPRFDENGNLTGLIHIARDMTVRKRMDEALRDSEEKYRRLFERAHDSIFIIDRSTGRILDVNENGARRLGYSHRSVLALNMEDIEDSMAVGRRDEIRRELDEKGSVLYEHAHRRKNGSLIPVEVSSRIVEYGGQKVIEAFVRDVSVRKRAEDEIRRSHRQLRDLTSHMENVREEERKRISREIHDELGQALTALNMDLSWFGGKVHTSLLGKVDSMTALVNKTIQTVQRISSELRPGLLDTLGLVAACEYEAGKYRDALDITVQSSLQLDEKILGQELSVALYRILQEALTNIVRHAEATGVRVRLEEDASHVILSVRDNGRGVTEEQMGRSDSFGLMGMRERAAMFGGSVEIVGAEGAGTAITVRVPVPER